jgi:long-chain acyl-CoA synthetase
MEKNWLKNYDSGVPHSIDYPNVNLYEMFMKVVGKYPNHPFTGFMGADMTYQEISSLVDKFAGSLVSLGVKQGDKVAIHLPNCPQFIIAYFAAFKLGAINVPCNPMYVAREMKHQLNDSGAETIITMTRFYSMIKGIQKDTKVKNVIATNIKDYFPGKLRILYTLFKEKKEGDRVTLAPGDYRFVDLVQKGDPAAVPMVKVSPTDHAVYMYTGGTTGLSKGAVLTHKNLVANSYQLVNWMPDVEEAKESILAVLPLFHSYGMTLCMNFAILLGAKTVMLPRFDLKMALEAIQKEKINYFPGVPTMYVAINNSPETPKYDLSSIKVCISGAAPLPVEVQKKFEELSGGKLIEGYGLSETSPVTHANPIVGLRKAGSIGLPMPDTNMKIVDVDTGVDLPLGEIGEICINGPQVMEGYLNMPEETANVLTDGWLKTGDIARIDEDGFTYIVDRKKDMIIAGGFNIYPRDIEEVLFTHPKIKEAVVAGIRDQYRGETIKAYCVLKDGESLTEEEVIKFCRENLAAYKAPKRVEFRKELPKTMVGKVLRRVLREEEEKKLKDQTG